MRRVSEESAAQLDPPLPAGAQPDERSARTADPRTLGADAILRLQRRVGNAVVSRLVASTRPPPHTPKASAPANVIQRLKVDMAAGGAVGDPPATNHREAVRLALDRMHELWGIENDVYGRIYPAVSGLAPGDAVTDAGVLSTVQAALARTNEPVLVPEVSRAQFAMGIGAGVGAGQPNHAADLEMLQDLLEASGMLSAAASPVERAVARGSGPKNTTTLPHTFAGISQLKMRTVAGLGKVKWAPLIRANEADAAGEDRLADRRFQYQDFMVFVPTGAVAAPLVNDVHIFFSAGGVTGGSSHVEHHGLRGSAD